MNNELIESIKKMAANGNRLELPKNEQFANYAQVKKCLITAGGKYNRCGFIFSDDAQAVKDRLIGGEAINDKKKFQFFATPAALAAQIVELANIQPDSRMLEPSAGQGAIAELLRAKGGELRTVELMPQNIAALDRLGLSPFEGDFLTMDSLTLGHFDRIVANPPFTKNQDIDHIRHMHKLLKPGGKLVSIASKSWTFGSQKKQVAFREWLDEVGATTTEIPAGAFKESGTQISAVIVEIEA